MRAPVPGLGHSSPIVAGETVLVTTAVPVGRSESDLRVGRAGVAMAADFVPHEMASLPRMPQVVPDQLLELEEAVSPRPSRLPPVLDAK